MVDVEKEDQIDTSLSLPSTLIKQGNELTNQIIEEDDPAELDKLAQLFSLNQKKKQIARTNKISNLIELVDDEVITRIAGSPEAIEDKDLIKYWQIAQDSLSPKKEDTIEIPKVTINNQTNVNINSSGLNRESRAKVLEYVQQVMGSLQQTDNDDIIDINPKEK